MNDQLRKVHEARIAALLAGDVDELDNYVADDLTYTSPHGKVMGKQEVFGNFRSGAMKITRMEIDDLAVREHGDAAIMTYRALTKFTDHGTVIDGAVRSTAIYLRREGIWKLAAQQQTSIDSDCS